MSQDNIVLGEGVFSIAGVDVGLTRGGGKFTVEREYRAIESDGDYGPVKGRIQKIKSVAKLMLNAMELLPANLLLMYPALQVATDGGTDTITAKSAVEATDYNSNVKWTGKTSGGRPVVITLENAINLENIDWGLVDKDEVVPSITYTAAYLDSARTTEPWKLEYLPSVVSSGGLTALSVQDNTPTSVTLTPTFATAKLSYTGAILTAKTGVTVTPTAASHTIKVNGETVASGATSSAIAIAAGELKLITIVTQEVNKLPVTYEVRIYRA